ncbi:MAG: diguanylate cyclase [Inhella sp.]|jgi:diguanylate cyclase (GGDEF)-like protein|uniref:GGDEF domain-containing protein n=1 Tax=Inhella sp. TaxID=1921806 RepID=UPI0022C65415|nr:GGDEF domain-containing protein [Inhella sp.]MCZ8235279.1 GGDEF domain-containing protein [Inhella sp.]
MALHLPTVMMFAGLLTAVVTLGLGLLAWRERRAYLMHWAAALATTFVGMLLFGLRGTAPDLLTIVTANVMLLGNLLFTLSGYLRLFGQPVPVRAMLALVLVQTLVYGWLTFGVDDYPTRMLVFNSTLVVLSAASALVLRQHRHRFGWAVLALPVGAHLVQVLMGLVRIGLTLQTNEPTPSFMQASQGHVMAIMLNTLAALALAFGFLSLHASHLLEALEKQAATDPLTGLSNRRGFDRALALEWERQRRRGSSLAVLVIDIDHFKQINDQHGHAVGDTALRHLGQVLRQHLRPYDLSGRLGGEEFCVVSADTDLEGARRSAERLRQASLVYGHDANGQPLGLTLSIGVAVVQADDQSPHDAIRRADAALYRAKQNGRNRVELG